MNRKRILNALLSAALISAPVAGSLINSMPITAATIQITGQGSGEYTAYQIFQGDESDGILSNIEWGSDVDTGDDDFEEAMEAFGGPTAEGVAKYLEENKDKVKEFAAAISEYVTGGKEIENGSATVAGGYYLIINTSADSDKTLSAFMMDVTSDGTATFTPKNADFPDFSKKVQDINDTNETNLTEPQDTADWDIGDEVPFTLTATLPDGFSNYKKYNLVFHDDLSDGLTFLPDSVEVKVDGVTLTKNVQYRVVTSPTNEDDKFEGCDFEIVIENLQDIESAAAGKNVVVTYKATLNSGAQIGNPGNPNDAYLEFTNDPNWDGEGEEPTDDTEIERNIVFTFEVTVDKVDEAQKALEGAEFALYKEIPASKISGQPGSDRDSDLLLIGGKYYKKVGSPEAKAGPDGSTLNEFVFEGIDDGNYMLRETVTPPGYNTIADKFFTLDATHDLDGSSVTFTGDIDSSQANVVNEKGTTLPETGGIGTQFLYIGGAVVLAAGAVVLTLTARKKRD